MKTHVQVLGILFLISAAFLAFLAVAFPLGMSVVGWFVGQSGDPDANVALPILGLVGTGLAVLFGFLAVVWGICGYGVLKHKPWARIFAIILCAMSLIKIPVGTAFGVYGLWIMFNKETEAMFAGSPAA
jgi:hypothetical protein